MNVFSVLPYSLLNVRVHICLLNCLNQVSPFTSRHMIWNGTGEEMNRLVFGCYLVKGNHTA